jgi:hypothetical protein
MISGNYMILDCIQNSLDSVQFTIKNSSNKTLTLCQPNCFGFAFENNENFHAIEINSYLADMQESNAESEFSDAEPNEESIDE